VALRQAVESRESRLQVVDDRQLTVGVTDGQQSPHRVAAHDDPVHITSPAMDVDVVQRRECLASHEVNGAKVEHQLLRDPNVLFDVSPERSGIGGVDVPYDGNDHPGRRCLSYLKSRSSPPFLITRRRSISAVNPHGACSSHPHISQHKSYVEVGYPGDADGEP
jgi:hypothetical protein